MAGKPKPMSQVKQVLVLHQQGVGVKTIARNLGISKNTVKLYIKRAQESGQTQDALISAESPVLSNLLLSGTASYKTNSRYDALCNHFPSYTKELEKTGVTLQLLWEEYRVGHPDGYRYTQFCFHYNQYIKAKKPSCVLSHKPAEKLFVDFAGDTLDYIDRLTGERIKCQTFVACLPYSDYGFAMIVPSQKTTDFIKAIESCFEHLGGSPQLLVCDNLKSAVIKADRYEPQFNELLAEFANHYQIGLLPARVARPKDKALVENQVKLIYNRVYAQLRNTQFFDIESLNEAVAQKMLEHNQKRMQHHDYCREESFLSAEKPLLRPLPERKFELKYYKTLTVAHNNHVFLGCDKHHYSVPYQYIGQKAQVIFTATLVNIYVEGKQVATHPRMLKAGYSTEISHLCSAHQFHNKQGAEYYLEKAKKHSTELHLVMKGLLNSYPHPELAYRSCNGILALTQKHPEQEVINACKLVIDTQLYTYRFIKNLIVNKLSVPATENFPPSPDHANIRGSQYYQ